MKFFQLSSIDFLKGFVTAVLMSVITGLYTSLQATPPHLPTGSEWGTIGIVGLGAGVSYLIKNLFTNSKDQMFKGEPK